MASVKFGKDSQEWKMFTEYWQLVQKYYEIEKNDNYWNEMMKEFAEFGKKYKDIPLSKPLAIGFVDTRDKLFQDMKNAE